MEHPSNKSNSASRAMPPEVTLGLLDVLDIGLLFVDRMGNVTYRNQAASGFLPDSENLDALFASAVSSDGRDDWAAALSRVIETGEPCSIVCTAGLNGSGAPTPLRARLLPARHHVGTPDECVVVLVERASATPTVPDRVDVSEHLASLGDLAASVAHELNNPLDAVLRYVNLAMRLSEDVREPRLQAYLAHSRSGLLRVIEIIAEMLACQPQAVPGGTETCDVGDIVDEAIRTQASASREAGVTVHVEMCGALVPSSYGTRLFQMCSNLIRNAIDAMPHGGRLTVAAHVVHDTLVIRFADTGAGLPRNVEHLFEPFYTTKAPGRGTGLGLAVCRDCVTSMGGVIEASPRDEGGAVFTVRIPVDSTCC